MNKPLINPIEIDQFVAGVLPKESPEYERIVRDLAENPDGQVWSYLESSDEQRVAHLEAMWEKVFGPGNGDSAYSLVDSTQSVVTPAASDTSKASLTRRNKSLLIIASTTSLIAIGLLIWSFRPQPTQLLTWIDDPLGRIGLYASGDVQGLEAFPADWQRPIASMVATGGVHVPKAALDFRRVTRGSDMPTAYLDPANTVVFSTMPTFRWKSYGPGEMYEIVIYSSVERVQIRSSGLLAETTWQLTEADELERGMVYDWELVLHRDGKEELPDEPRARFRVLSAAELALVAEEVERAKGSHLVLAVAYLDAGLLVDAERELRTLAKVNPTAKLPQQWLNSLKQQR